MDWTQSIKNYQSMWVEGPFDSTFINNSVALCGSDGDLGCLLYTSPSPRDLSTSRMPSSA